MEHDRLVKAESGGAPCFVTCPGEHGQARAVVTLGMARKKTLTERWAVGLVAASLLGLAGCTDLFEEPRPVAAPSEPVTTESLPRPARPASPSQHGIATYYARKFTNRLMADGSRFDPRSDSAASQTLPLGSRAEVTNLDNGRKAIVTIRDRGPHVRGAIIDVSPKTAEALGMMHRGRARVQVTPLAAEQTKRPQGS
jgi:rare lipoprotein A